MNKLCKLKKAISLTLATGMLLTSSLSIGCFAETVECNDVKIEKVLDEATKEAATGSSLAKFVEAVTEVFGKFKKGASSTYDTVKNKASAAYDSAKNKASSAYESAKQSVSTNYDALKNKANDLRKGGKTENDQYWEELADKSGAEGNAENAVTQDKKGNKTFAEFILWLRTRAKDSKVNKYFNYLADGLEKLANNWKVTAGVSLAVAGAAVMVWLGKKAISGWGNGATANNVPPVPNAKNLKDVNDTTTLDNQIPGNVNNTITLDNQIPGSNSNITIPEGFTPFEETCFDKIRNKIIGGALVAVLFIVGIFKWCLPNKPNEAHI